MNIDKYRINEYSLKEVIKTFIADNYGNDEAENPSYDVDKLSHAIYQDLTEITDDKKRLCEHVQSIANDVNDGIQITNDNQYDYMLHDGDYPYEEGDYMTGFDYLSDVLDIQYVVDNENNIKGCIFLVAFGGPNIYIDTYRGCVRGYWGGDYHEVSISGEFVEELEQTANEIRNC